MSHHLRLVSFKLCPFVQRSVIVLKHQNIPFEIDYIDVYNPPEWFKALSPLGKVPIVQVDHDQVIFESAVIMELVSELNPPLLHPTDPVAKAHNRAWIEFGSAMLGSQFQMHMADNEEAFEKARTELAGQILRVEEQLQHQPFFNGEQLNLIDAAYAPLFTRLALVDSWLPLNLLDNAPRMAAWGNTLRALPAVQQSVVPEFAELMKERIQAKNGYLATKLSA